MLKGLNSVPGTNGAFDPPAQIPPLVTSANTTMPLSRRVCGGRGAPRTPPAPSPFLDLLASVLQRGLPGALPCLLFSCGDPSLPCDLACQVSREGSHAILADATPRFPVRKRLRP